MNVVSLKVVQEQTMVSSDSYRLQQIAQESNHNPHQSQSHSLHCVCICVLLGSTLSFVQSFLVQIQTFTFIHSFIRTVHGNGDLFMRYIKT